MYDLGDPGLQVDQVPRFAYRWHTAIANDFAPWANDRIDSQKASKLTTDNVSGTEWPMFSAVLYLWSTEALQENWETNPQFSKKAPKDYAKEAIDAAAKLIIDPNNASWVKAHWGSGYLHKENLFYRMLLIAGLTSYQKLSGNNQYEEVLIGQVTSLSKELDESPYGLLDDYPGECYPVDILPAIAVLNRAGELLGMDKSDFVERSLRAFEDDRLDNRTGLPAYIANSKTGHGYGPARGVGISYMLIWAPELWPEVASAWYGKYEEHFWNEGSIISGFFEFPRNSGIDSFFFDVDAGPVISQYGVAASAFGIGAAKVNNQQQQFYPLATEALVASWPLPDGTLLLPRLLSNLADAPYIGESALLFTMTRQSLYPGSNNQVEHKLPYIVYLALVFYCCIGLIILRGSIKLVRSLG
ncbi:hypothetical protein [Zooshikella harenae]|uniref:Linalool dehydratase/isomerase domain-containing protein n=1 Tax=Zooshikella harenae TaxID=2827238 RepID=A0ABS5Z6N1_9GAMM|nr:hypothetical protein [Zooshikella harenae]MBU2709649.1 hypothetical protein [Zooshikella harenae]